jgi:hypothetical protein
MPLFAFSLSHSLMPYSLPHQPSFNFLSLMSWSLSYSHHHLPPISTAASPLPSPCPALLPQEAGHFSQFSASRLSISPIFLSFAHVLLPFIPSFNANYAHLPGISFASLCPAPFKKQKMASSFAIPDSILSDFCSMHSPLTQLANNTPFFRSCPGPFALLITIISSFAIPSLVFLLYYAHYSTHIHVLILISGKPPKRRNIKNYHSMVYCFNCYTIQLRDRVVNSNNFI